jgi:TetR/AcrR family transcriptional repressor of nem operon
MNRLSKGDHTQQHIIAVAASLIYRQGFNHTGIAQIIKEAAISKGAFYFHFKDKDTLGMDVIDYFSEKYITNLTQHLHHPNLNVFEKFNAFYNFYRHLFSTTGFAYGCPIGNLTQELTDLCPLFAHKLNDTICLMSQVFKDTLLLGIENGDLHADIDVQQTADFMIDSWQGALLRMKLTRNDTPLKNWIDINLTFLFQHQRV